jgi:hypothetical protein
MNDLVPLPQAGGGANGNRESLPQYPPIVAANRLDPAESGLSLSYKTGTARRVIINLILFKCFYIRSFHNETYATNRGRPHFDSDPHLSGFFKKAGQIGSFEANTFDFVCDDRVIGVTFLIPINSRCYQDELFESSLLKGPSISYGIY